VDRPPPITKTNQAALTLEAKAVLVWKIGYDFPRFWRHLTKDQIHRAVPEHVSREERPTIYEMTVQIRVSPFETGLRWYRTLFQREPDFVPHKGFAEWELVPGCWLQLADGNPTVGSGPLRLGVTNIQAQRQRVIEELNVDPFEVYSRPEVPVKWGTFSDPWGNRLGFFEYLDPAEKERAIGRARR